MLTVIWRILFKAILTAVRNFTPLPHPELAVYPVGVNLPARVRVTRPPLPLAPALRTATARLCPDAPLDRLTTAALAIAGGAVIGAHLVWHGGEVQFLETGWRGQGIEEALAKAAQKS